MQSVQLVHSSRRRCSVQCQVHPITGQDLWPANGCRSPSLLIVDNRRSLFLNTSFWLNIPSFSHGIPQIVAHNWHLTLH